MDVYTVWWREAPELPAWQWADPLPLERAEKLAELLRSQARGEVEVRPVTP
jgi:hypothetical protein